MNLLTDPVFRVNFKGINKSLCLPALLAALGENKIGHLTGIQKHQHDAFYIFLCYLAGAVLNRKGKTNPVQNEDFWRESLLDLSSDVGFDAWEMYNEDYSKPAFMQSPMPNITRKPTSIMTTPDQLDVLVTTKNHDIKSARAELSHTDNWIYALISLQTMSGYLGVGNYGISRMNSGYGSRAVVELFRNRRMGPRWVDAVSRLLDHRQQVLKQSFGFDPHGTVLTWLSPWDGKTSFELHELDPFFIETCRMIRLRGGESVQSAQFYPALKPQINAKSLNGVVGDPWLPVEKKGLDKSKNASVKAFTFPPVGITAAHMHRLIFGKDLQMSSMHKPRSNWDTELWFSASVLVRGQGITDGFHHWEMRIPKEKSSMLFGNFSQREALEELSQNALQNVATMQNKVLKPSVFTFVQGAPQKLDFSDSFGGSAWTRASKHFTSLWSERYFPWLFSVPEDFDEDEVLRQWLDILTQKALAVLKEIEIGMANHSARKYRILTEVRSRFWGGLYYNFDLKRRDVDGSITN